MHMQNLRYLSPKSPLSERGLCRFAPNGFRSLCFIKIPDQVGDDFHCSYVIAVLSGCFYGISGLIMSVSWSFSSRKPS